jgi:hypothetical protein
MARTASMTKLPMHVPHKHIEVIKPRAAEEDLAFAEMARRCLHLGMMQLLTDRAAFAKS